MTRLGGQTAPGAGGPLKIGSPRRKSIFLAAAPGGVPISRAPRAFPFAPRPIPRPLAYIHRFSRRRTRHCKISLAQSAAAAAVAAARPISSCSRIQTEGVTSFERAAATAAGEDYSPRPSLSLSICPLHSPLQHVRVHSRDCTCAYIDCRQLIGEKVCGDSRTKRFRGTGDPRSVLCCTLGNRRLGVRRAPS